MHHSKPQMEASHINHKAKVGPALNSEWKLDVHDNQEHWKHAEQGLTAKVLVQYGKLSYARK